jgi:hypothetical protein
MDAKKILIGGAVLVAACIIYQAAKAMPPPEAGMTVSFRDPMIVCDTKQHIKDIVDSHKVSGAAFDAKITELASGDKASCNVGQLDAVTVGESEDLGTTKWNDVEEHLYVIHFGTYKGEWYGLYETVDAPKGESI